MPMPRRPSAPAYRIPLSDNELALIGSFITTWNLVEMFMEIIVHMALGISVPTAARVMGSPNIRPQVDILSAVVKEKIQDPAIHKKVDECTKRILALSDFRNAVVHSAWFAAADGGESNRKKGFSCQNADHRFRHLSKTGCGAMFVE
jgi:hypothetical protein